MAISRKTVEAKVKDAFVEWAIDIKAPTEQVDLKMDKPLSEQGIDSLDFVEVVMALEDEFGIMIEDDEANSFKTAMDFVDHIAKKIGA